MKYGISGGPDEDFSIGVDRTPKFQLGRYAGSTRMLAYRTCTCDYFLVQPT